METHDEKKREYQHYELPVEFWVSLIQVRNYLWKDEAFQWFVTKNRFQQGLPAAFLLVDAYIESRFIARFE